MKTRTRAYCNSIRPFVICAFAHIALCRHLLCKHARPWRLLSAARHNAASDRRSPDVNNKNRSRSTRQRLYGTILPPFSLSAVSVAPPPMRNSPKASHIDIHTQTRTYCRLFGASGNCVYSEGQTLYTNSNVVRYILYLHTFMFYIAQKTYNKTYGMAACCSPYTTSTQFIFDVLLLWRRLFQICRGDDNDGDGALMAL